MDPEERSEVDADFRELVNMTPKELEGWLGTDESRQVGQKPTGGGESTGHHSGRRILEILDRKKSDLDDDDYEHMRYVRSYIKRHLAQGGPDEDAEHSPWRYSLMNWGHDPLKG